MKNEGLTASLFKRALQQAKEARFHILDLMDPIIEQASGDLPENVPKMLRFEVDPDCKGKIIGPGGSNIRRMIEEFSLVNMQVYNIAY